MAGAAAGPPGGGAGPAPGGGAGRRRRGGQRRILRRRGHPPRCRFRALRSRARARLTVLLELPERAAGYRGCRAMLEPLAAADVALRAFSKWWLVGAEPVYHGWCCDIVHCLK